MPDISFIYLTNRPGGIDLLGMSLSGQMKNIDEISPELQRQFKDAKPNWELIVVDDYSNRFERGEAAKYLSSLGLPLSYYGKSKDKWYKDARQGLANAMNTGLIVARSPYVVFLHDYSLYPSWAPAAWLHSLQNNERSLVHGIAMIFTSKPPDLTDDIYTWNEIVLTQERIWFPDKFELFYVGMPMTFFEKTGGIDERGDYCGYFNLASVIRQAFILDYQLKVVSGLYCWQVDHRQWGVPAVRLTSDQRMFDNLWKGWGDVTALKTMPFWTVPSANGFNLVEEQRLIRQHMEVKK